MAKQNAPEGSNLAPEMSITSPDVGETRLLGSRSSFTTLQPQRRPRDDDDPEPDPDQPPPPPPPPAVSAPDVALQFLPCLEELNLPNIDLKAAVVGAVRDAFGGSAD